MSTLRYSLLLLTTLLLGVVSCSKPNHGSDEEPFTPSYGFIAGNSSNVLEPGVGTGSESKLTAITKLTAEQLSAYGSTQITGMRLGVTAASTECTAFIRDSKTGENLAEASFTYNPMGWSYAEFAEPFDIPENTELYIGYTLTSAGFAVGIDDATTMSKIDEVAVDNSWTPISSVCPGNLAIQAILGGGDYSSAEPQYDIAVGADPVGVVKGGSTTEMTACIANEGINPITKVTVKGTYNGESYTEDITVNINTGEYKTVNFGAFNVPDEEATIEFEFTFEIPGQEDPTDNNSFSGEQTVSVGQYDLNMVLIEQFTGQTCPNCPGGSQSLKSAISEMTNPEKICWVAHHSGYYPDSFTLDESVEISQFLGVNAAPMSSINRTKQRFGNGQTVLVSHPGYITTSMLNSLANVRTNASIAIEHSYDASSRELTVTVSGETTESDIKVTALVMQSGILATQSGASGSYSHNNAPRLFLSAGLGDEVEISGGKYTKTYTVELPETVGSYDVVDEDVEIVAFVAVNGTNRNDSPVINAAKKPLVATKATKKYTAPANKELSVRPF